MESINEYLLVIIGAIAASEMLAAILPSGSFKPYVRFAVGVLLMTALIFPLTRCSAQDYESVFKAGQSESEPVESGSYTDMILDAYEEMETDG